MAGTNKRSRENANTDPRERFLGSAAYADTKHDFGHGKFRVKHLDIVLNQRKMYNEGIFVNNEDFDPKNYKDEDILLNSLITDDTEAQDTPSRSNTLDKILNEITQPNSNLTIHNNVTGKPIQYNVKGIIGKIILNPTNNNGKTKKQNGGEKENTSKTKKVVKAVSKGKPGANKLTKSERKKNKKYISASELLADEFGLENNAALVIDATSVSISTILKTGEQLSDKRIYYVMTPEILNDPAGKTSCKDISDTNKSARGVHFIPIVEENGKDRVYNYEHGSDDSFEQFLTTYSFRLSKMGTKHGMKNSSHTTDLTITHPKHKVVLPDSKNQNAIAPLAASLNKIITDKRKNYNEDAIFDMNRRFQQKRSGDWLQVLLCKNILDREMRIFKDFKTKPVQPLPEPISKVYLVTHDRVALAFALYSGVECIFTHGVKLYKFTFDNPLTAAEREAANIVNERNTLLKNIQNMRVQQEEVNNMLEIYNEHISDFFGKSEFKIDENVVTNILNDKTVVYENINDIVHTVFEKAYQYSYYKSLYPDLSNLLDVNVKANIEYLVGVVSSIENKNMDELKRLNQIYSKYQAIINNAYKVLSGFVTKISEQPKYSVIDYTGKHAAQSSYIIINKWDWKTQYITARQFPALIKSLDTSKTPSCIFLYELQHLSDEWQRFILARFSQIYSDIQVIDRNPEQYNLDDNTGNLDSKFGQQFRYVVKFLCINVLIAMDSNYDKNNIELYIADYFKNANIVKQGSLAKIMNAVENAGNIMRSWFITDVQVVTEHNEITKGRGINFWDTTTKFIEQLTGIPNEDETDNQNKRRRLKGGSINGENIPTSETTSDVSNQEDMDIQFSYNEKQVSYRKLGFMLNYPKTTNVVNELGKILYVKGKSEQVQELPFQTYSGCFHPLLPIYVLSEGLYQMTFDHIDESMDYELYLQYFELLKRMREELEYTYQPATSDKNTINNRQVTAYFIGIGIRELFINANILSLGMEQNELYIKKFMDLTQDEYMPIFLMNTNIRNIVLGNVEDNRDNISRIVLEYSKFVDFLNEVDIPSIFYSEEDTPIKSMEEFQQECYDFLIETGEKLITSRLGPYKEVYEKSQLMEEASPMDIGPDEVSTEISSVEASSTDTVQDEAPFEDTPREAWQQDMRQLVQVQAGGRNYTKSNNKVIRHQTIRKRHK